MRGLERGQKPRQHVRRDRWDDAERERPRKQTRAVASIVGEIAHAGKNARHPARRFLSFGRQPRASARPLDQDDAYLSLQLLDLHRKRRLGYGALLRSPPEMQRLGERVEIAKLPHGDVRHKRILSQLQIMRTDLIELLQPAAAMMAQKPSAAVTMITLAATAISFRG